MHVSELMAVDVAWCEQDAPLTRAAQLMWDRDVGCVPVVDDQRRLVGMITDRDICMAALLRGRRLDEIAVHEVMARQPAFCTEREDVECAARRMASRQVRRMPVVDDGDCLLGMLSVADFARDYARRGGTTAGAVAMLIARVGEPRSDDPSSIATAA